MPDEFTPLPGPPSTRATRLSEQRRTRSLRRQTRLLFVPICGHRRSPFSPVRCRDRTGSTSTLPLGCHVCRTRWAAARSDRVADSVASRRSRTTSVTFLFRPHQGRQRKATRVRGQTLIRIAFPHRAIHKGLLFWLDLRNCSLFLSGPPTTRLSPCDAEYAPPCRRSVPPEHGRLGTRPVTAMGTAIQRRRAHRSEQHNRPQ